MSTFDIGINYWPAKTGMRWWKHFSREEFIADLGLMREAGCASVRVFLRWEDFQPQPDMVSTSALRDLVTVADLTATHGLQLAPTLFTGHMSGANWIPRWATKPGAPDRFRVVFDERYQPRVVPRNWFDDEEIMGAQERLAREAATALRGHPALWAWDLGNESSNVCFPRTREQGRAWLSRMTDALRYADPACRVTVGLHMEDLDQDRRLGPAQAAEVCDFLCMHGYPLYAPWAKSPTDPTLPAFLAQVTRWLGGGKDLFFEEFGMPTRTTEEDDKADVFIAEALDDLYESGTTGAMLWCFSDYAKEIWDDPPLDVAPHERFFGLWRADGTAKPAARHLSRYRGVERRDVTPLDWIDVDRARYYDAPLENLKHLYARFSDQVAVAR